MLNSHDPSFSAVSLALHVTDVKPTAYVSPDITTVPEPSSHIMLAARIEPSTLSLADGNGDHVTLATAIPASTFMEATVLGHATVGASLSA